MDGTRKQYLEVITTVPLLILDDFGMRELPQTAAEDLLEIIIRRYERASMLVTSHRPVEDWSELLGDAAAVGAMLDRLLRHTATCSSADRAVGGPKWRPVPRRSSAGGRVVDRAGWKGRGCGNRGKPDRGFPPFPPPLGIA